MCQLTVIILTKQIYLLQAWKVQKKKKKKSEKCMQNEK